MVEVEEVRLSVLVCLRVRPPRSWQDGVMGHSGNQSVDFRIIRGQQFVFCIHLFTRHCYSTVHIQHYDSDPVQSVTNNNTANV